MLYSAFPFIPYEEDSCTTCCPQWGAAAASFEHGSAASGARVVDSLALGSCVYCANAASGGGSACQSIHAASAACAADSPVSSSLTKSDSPDPCVGEAPPLAWQEKFRNFRGTYAVRVETPWWYRNEVDQQYFKCEENKVETSGFRKLK